MPSPNDNLIGRDELLAALVERVESDASVITLVGAPGVGKSSLAREALRRAELPVTVVCDLAMVREPPAFVAALARALRVETDAELFEAVATTLRRRSPVVLLDNFDHLVEHADQTLARLADEVPNVLFVVTTRQRLGLVGEEVVDIGPLSIDDAVALFVARSPVELGEDDLEIVRRLVDRIDENPLAIELAAARLRTFTPADLLDRLDRRFRLLRSRAGGSLEDAIAVSWELLDPHERRALAQTTVFRGGFDLDAAEAVIELDDGPWALDVVEALVEKSLLSRTHRGRLQLSQSIRAFVEEQAAEPPPSARHAAYYAGLADTWPGQRWTAKAGARAAEELHNLVAVLDRFETTDPAPAVRAAEALHALLRHRGITMLHEALLTRGISSARRADDDASAARLLQARGELGVVTGRLQRAEEDSREASALAEATGQPDVVVRAEIQRAEAERRTGRATAARARLLALRERDDIPWSVNTRRAVDAHLASCQVELGTLEAARELLLHIEPATDDVDDVDEYLTLKRLAYAHYYLGNYEQQHRLNADALELAERVGDRRRVARARQGLGDAAFARGDFDEARREYEVALAEHRELGNEHLTGVLLGNLGSAEHRCDALESAAARYHEALTMHQRAGATPYEAVVNFALGVLEHERGHLDDALFRYARARELFDDLGQHEDLLATQVACAWLELERGAPDECLGILESLESSDADWRAVIERTAALARGDADIAEHEPGRELAGRLARALGDLVAGAPIHDLELRTTLQGRLLLRLAAGDREPPVAAASARPDVVVGRDGEWFQTTGESVNLRRRKAHRRFLDELATRHAGGGEPLDVYDAFDLGWPGESIEPEAAAERVYWVVGVLRRLGLDGILLTSDEGYYLDPDARVVRDDYRR